MIKTVMDRKCTQILAEKDQTHSLCGHQVIDRRLNVSTFNLCIRLRMAKFREVGLYEKNIRLSYEVIQHFKSSGVGWQTRIDAALREFIQSKPNSDLRR
jgi:hypothetical protein